MSRIIPSLPYGLRRPPQRPSVGMRKCARQTPATSTSLERFPQRPMEATIVPGPGSAAVPCAGAAAGAPPRFGVGKPAASALRQALRLRQPLHCWRQPPGAAAAAAAVGPPASALQRWGPGRRRAPTLLTPTGHWRLRRATTWDGRPRGPRPTAALTGSAAASCAARVGGSASGCATS